MSADLRADMLQQMGVLLLGTISESSTGVNGVAGRIFTLAVSWGFLVLLLKTLVILLKSLQFQAIPINNPYTATCLIREGAASKSLQLL
jgi:hypothetical protein